MPFQSVSQRFICDKFKESLLRDYITQPGINPEVPGGITEEVNGLLAESYAVATRVNYTSKMTKFIAFAAQYRLVETAYNGAVREITPILSTLSRICWCQFFHL